ncbi:MAG: TonB-dependent receptor [Bacteroidota bacterium]
MIRWLLVITIIATHLLTVAQNNCAIRLSGIVIDLDDAQPLAYATIAVTEQKRIVIADAEGNFVMDSLCPGKIVISVRHLDCTDTSILIELKNNKSISIRLPHTSVRLRDLEVYGEAKTPRLTDAISQIEGAVLDAKRGGNLADITSTANGVTSLNTGSSISKPMIHGLQGYRILLISNGIRLEGQQWGNEHAPEIDPNLAKKITVIKGASGLRYGADAIGGVILVEPEELSDSTKLSGDFYMTGNSNGRGGSVSGIMQGSIPKITGLAWRVQGTIRKQGNINTPNYILSTTALEENNFSYTLGYHKKRWGTELFYSQFNTRIGIFSGSHIGNLTDLNNAFNGTLNYDTASFSYKVSRPYQDVGHELIKGNFHIHTGKRSRLNINYGYQYNIRKEFDKDAPLNDSLAQFNLPDLDYRIETHLAEAVWDHDNVRSFRGLFGTTYMHQENVYRGRFFIPNYIADNFGVFGTERYIKHKFEAELGVRYDVRHLQCFLWENNLIIDPKFNFSNWSAHGGIIIKKDSCHNFLFNSSMTWRSPAVNELFANGLHHGAASIEKGDRMLTPERGWNSSITAIGKIKKVRWEITAYSNYIKDFIYQQPGTQPQLTIKGAFPVFYFKQTDALISGADFDMSIYIGKRISFNIKAMYLYGQNLEKQEPLVFMPSNRIKKEIIVNLPDKGAFKNNLITIDGLYVSRQYRTPFGVDYKVAPPDYFLINISLTTKIGKKKTIAILYAGVNNLMNIAYRDYLDRFRYFCDAPGRNIYFKIQVPIKK